MIPHSRLAAKINSVPAIDLRQNPLILHNAERERIVHIGTCRTVEYGLEIARPIGLLCQVRATPRGAIVGVLGAQITPDRPQGSVFNIAEGKEFAIDADQLLVSGRVDVTDRFHRIKLKHQTHCQLIVKNDPIGHLFRIVKPQDIGALKRT